jgi:hypothetical protein
MPVAKSHHRLEHVRLETAVDQVPHPPRPLHLTLLADGYLTPSQPSAFLIVDAEGVNEHIHIVVAS